MIYLATPYSHPDPKVMQQRFLTACKLAAEMMKNGDVVFSPIAHTHPIAVAGDLPKDWTYWERFDREFIEAAEKLVVAKMNGWDRSRGVTAEIAIAKRLEKPIEYVDVNE